MANNCSTSCALIGGWEYVGCSKGTGGISKVYISTGYTAYDIGSDCTLTGLTGGTWFTFDQIQETSSQTEKSVSSIGNQSLYFEGEIEIILPTKNNWTTIRNQFNTLARSGCVIITLNNNGDYKIHGLTNKCELSEGSISDGKLMGDSQSCVMKFQYKEPNPSYKLTSGSVFNSTY